MLILSFFFPSLLFFAFIIFPTLFTDKDGNASLIYKTSSMFSKKFILEACTYDFLILKDFIFFFVTVPMFLVEGGTVDIAMLQTSFSLYLYNQWTDFHKLSCAGKP